SGRQCTHDECATYGRRDLVFTFHCLRPPANGMTVLWFVELTSQQKTRKPPWRNRYGLSATLDGGIITTLIRRATNVANKQLVRAKLRGNRSPGLVATLQLPGSKRGCEGSAND